MRNPIRSESDAFYIAVGACWPRRPATAPRSYGTPRRAIRSAPPSQAFPTTPSPQRSSKAAPTSSRSTTPPAATSGTSNRNPRRARAIAGRTLTRAEWHDALPERDYAPACADH
jgi:hypothetical protein